jgi:carboxylesterase type B
LKSEFGDATSEDCLFINVFAPSSAASDKPLPVYVFIQGGGFNGNSNANFDGTKLVQATDMNAVIVNFNYRVAAYGFLASREMQQNQSFAINAGLLDQRMALNWVQKHIQSFGGDPKKVTLGGASAGAGSVMLQLTAYGGRDDNLFQAAASESQSFPPLRTVDDSQFMFSALATAAGCTSGSDMDKLSCLQNVPSVEFQKAHKSVNGKTSFPDAADRPIWLWGPTLDGQFVKDYTYTHFQRGEFVKVPVIVGDASNEGTIFSPRGVASQEDADKFIKNNWPALTSQQFDKLHSAFNQGSIDRSAGYGDWFPYAADLFGKIRYVCPGTMVSDAFAKAGVAANYQYRWNVITDENKRNGNGATHVGELGPVWWGGDKQSEKDVHAYFASFIRSTGDPNKFSGVSQKWETWDGKNRILFDNTGTKMETVDDDTVKKCDAVHDIAVDIKQ